jgi:uncharacterized protein YqgC (DUF456 family)
VTLVEMLVGLAILVGLAGVLVPVLPGTSLILAAVLVWSITTGTGVAWVVFAVVTTLLVTGAVAKYALPGRGLKAAGVPNRTLVAGGLLALVGFFVVPVVGLVLGFVLGVYLAELQRLDGERAWPSTRFAVRAVGLSILIEALAAGAAAATWLATILVV